MADAAPLAHARPMTRVPDLIAAVARAGERAPPGAIYADPDFASWERERIFRHAWQPVGRIDELPEQGSYITHRILDTPIAVVRQADGGVKAFVNVCRHRGAELLRGDGCSRAITCPYHAWSYELDGRLAVAPFTGADFKTDGIALIELPLDLWQGWIFVALDPDEAPPSAALGDLEKRIAPRDMNARVMLFRADEVWACNWKTAVENFSEGYHIFSAHRTSLPGARPDRDVRNEPGGPNYSIHWSTSGFERTAQPAGKATEHPLVALFPNHLFFLISDRGLWMTPQPDGPMRTRVRWGATAEARTLPADPDARRSHIARIRAAYEKVNAEDRAICEGIARGSAAPGTGNGPVAPAEASLIDFWRWLARRLAGAGA